jgi:hypothetical protein
LKKSLNHQIRSQLSTKIGEKKFSCIVVIFLYKKKLESYEFKNIQLANLKLKDFLIVSMQPESYRVENPCNFYPIFIDDFYFAGTSGYDSCLMNKDFYRGFEINCSNILIIQPDVTIQNANLNFFIKPSFTFLGARWPNALSVIPIFGRKFQLIHKLIPIVFFRKKIFYFNGGLSLRKVDEFIKVLSGFSGFFAKLWVDTEDVFFGYIFSEKIKQELSNDFIDRFSMESVASKSNNLSSTFGFHALHKFNHKLMTKIHDKNNL